MYRRWRTPKNQRDKGGREMSDCWTCPGCGQMVYSLQVHRCSPSPGSWPTASGSTELSRVSMSDLAIQRIESKLDKLIALFNTSCKQNDCEPSTVIAVKDCTLSDSGTSCLILMKNGKWAYGSEVVVGTKLCTKDFKGI